MCITRIKELAYSGQSLRKIFKKFHAIWKKLKYPEAFIVHLPVMFSDGKTVPLFMIPGTLYFEGYG